MLERSCQINNFPVAASCEDAGILTTATAHRRHSSARIPLAFLVAFFAARG
jgi:hypothetical protein